MGENRMIHTPAERLPEAPEAVGPYAEILRRLDRIEDELGLRARRAHQPLPGSTVEPLGSEED